MLRSICCALGLVLVSASPALAQDTPATQTLPDAGLEARANDILAMIKGEVAPEEIIADSLLASVSAAQFAQINTQLKTQFGEPLGVDSVEPTGDLSAKITLRFERALVSGPMSLSGEDGKVIGLLFNNIEPINDTAEKIAADLAALSGSSAAWFGPLDGEPIFAYGDSSRSYPLGSTFKLYVLAAMARAVDEGRLSWDQTVPIDTKSFPSGIMQNWPDGAPVSLHTLATLMISISDNTATDLAIRAVGREAVEAELRATGNAEPDKTLPFLTTREMFVLKAGDMGEAYAAASEAEQRRILAELDLDGLERDRYMEVFTDGNPVLVEEIEWFASMQDQLGLMRVLAGLPNDTAREIMAVNTSFSDSEEADWSYVGFKGGSEPGVRNLSWLLRDDAGQWHMLAISWVDTEQEISTSELVVLAKRILALAN